MLQGGLKPCVLAAAFFVASAAVMAGDGKQTMSIEIEGADGKRMSLSLEADFVSELAEGLAGGDMHCDATTERDTRAMLEHLSKRGEGSKFTLRRDDGEILKARRKKGQLLLRIEAPDRKGTEVSLPWSFAECLLGHDATARRVDGELALSVEQEGAVRIRID